MLCPYVAMVGWSERHEVNCSIFYCGIGHGGNLIFMLGRDLHAIISESCFLVLTLPLLHLMPHQDLWHGLECCNYHHFAVLTLAVIVVPCLMFDIKCCGIHVQIVFSF